MNTVTDVIREDLDGLMHLMKEAYAAAGFCWPDMFLPEQRIRMLLKALNTEGFHYNATRHFLADLKKDDVTFNRLLALNPIVLIRSQEHGLYWRDQRSGYRPDLAHAGAYYFKESWESTNHCEPEKGIAYVKLPCPN